MSSIERRDNSYRAGLLRRQTGMTTLTKRDGPYVLLEFCPQKKELLFTQGIRARRIGTTLHSVLRRGCFTFQPGRTARAFTVKVKILLNSKRVRISQG